LFWRTQINDVPQRFLSLQTINDFADVVATLKIQMLFETSQEQGQPREFRMLSLERQNTV